MKRPMQLLAMIVVSCNNLAPQIAALLLLDPREFGMFSLGYLTFSLAASVALSAVSEAYARVRPAALDFTEPKNYAAVSTWLSAVFAVVAGTIFSILSDNYLVILLSAVSVGCAARRTTVRYHEQRLGMWRKILFAETTALLVFTAGLLTLFADVEGIVSILFAWSAAGVTIWFSGTMRRPGSVQAALKWVDQYKAEIKPLLRESLVLDASAIGTPYFLAPILGTVSFGIYRAVSNFNAPVRLILNFFRPRLSTISLEAALSAGPLLLMSAFSVLWGAVFSGILLYVAKSPSGIVMLDALAPYWLPTGIYMMFTVGVLYFYMIARTKVHAKSLWRGRLLQSSVSIAFPITGALFGGLSGAIWAYAMATILGNLTWFSVVQVQARKARE